ncbi:hypothetical protein M501DRAFT_1003887 [Patellaria atrata CBS 101060]|uniref:Uncharacterized protein n=1 Tax=Patellaria atrata CBS 101060 TaxID=1346257 RepID=A0A9P4SB78_9PEZI|nr:hypothetical protein M501DRAFT_1003887 [Patellaria atrata CBS 101060]
MAPALIPTVAITTGSILAILGFTLIGLEVSISSHVNDWENTGTSNLVGNLRGHSMPFLPANLERRSDRLILAAGSVAASAGIVGAITSVPKIKCHHQSWNSFIIVFMAAASTAFSICTLVYAFIKEADSATWVIPSQPSAGRLYMSTQRGYYTTEGWTCQVRAVMVALRDEMNDTCRESKAARWIMIPLLVFGFLLWVVSMVDSWRMGTKGRNRTSEKNVEGSARV